MTASTITDLTQDNEESMHTTFMIDGGAGRLITAIPALEKYARNNPKDNFRILTAAWDILYDAHPLLQNKIFNVNQKGVFDLHMKDRKLVVPEPYRLHSYYNKKKHITEAFDEEINKTNDHSDLGKVNLYVTEQERNSIRFIINELKKQRNRDKMIVIQPYGSGIRIEKGRPVDTSNRSLDVDFTLEMIKRLSEDYLVCFFGEKEFFHPGDKYSVNFHQSGDDLRLYMTLIAECDYFVGVDSLGQHIARAFDKPGLVIMGSTFEENISYPEHFTIYRNNHVPVYVPIRLSEHDCNHANKLNEKTMLFDQNDLERMLEIVNEKTGKKKVQST
jgi:ADP-heptose:LPS heptosyltransferase